MLLIVGTGLKPSHLTLEAIEKIKKCSKVYIDSYTSAFSEESVQELKKILGKKIFLLERRDLENKAQNLLNKAKKECIALLVIGNPFFATTHQQIFFDSLKQKIKTIFLPGISIFDYLGKTGLSTYKFGKTTSIVEWQENYKPESFYDTIKNNVRQGMHTLCLLDIKKKGLMKPSKAISVLIEIEKKRKTKILEKANALIISRAGSKKEKIVFGKLFLLKEIGFETPCSIIICGKLSEKEKEFVEKWRI